MKRRSHMNTISILDKDYAQWLKELRGRYRRSQIKAAVKVNQEVLLFYLRYCQHVDCATTCGTIRRADAVRKIPQGRRYFGGRTDLNPKNPFNPLNHREVVCFLWNKFLWSD